VIDNGSFESADVNGAPSGWEWPSDREAVRILEGVAPAGGHYVEFSADAAGPAFIAQETWAPDATESAEFRLWARGGGPDSGLRVTVRSVLDLGSGPVRAPILTERVPIDDADWDLIAFELPAAPNGSTEIEVSSYADGGAQTNIDVDAISLMVCRER
jgi:hypothetical protein